MKTKYLILFTYNFKVDFLNNICQISANRMSGSIRRNYMTKVKLDQYLLAYYSASAILTMLL